MKLNLKGMKYIEVTGYNNDSKYLIPLDKISFINFTNSCTRISLSNGGDINVVEDESSIRQMLSYQEAEIISEDRIESLYSQSKNYLDNDNSSKSKNPF